MDLIADIGATNTRCALLDEQGRISAAKSFLNENYNNLEGVLAAFLHATSAGRSPKRAALAIAAPVTGNDITMTNIGWRFSQSGLAALLGTEKLTVLNDFEALAYALPRLGPEDCLAVGHGEPHAGAAMAVLGPGSGLGVASVLPHGDDWIAVSGEGGHVSLPAMNAEEEAVIAAHRDATGHCSAEHLLSGPGLVRICSTLAGFDGRRIEPSEPADITARAAAGDALAQRTFDIFFALLGTVAGNLALTVGARGGVFIAGGIVPRVAGWIGRSAFREHFIAKGRYRNYLDAIPTAVVCTETPAFTGLKACLGLR